MTDSYRNDPDVELMLRVVKGDRPSFELLVTKYQKTVLNTAFRYTGNPSVAEELAQDVFVRVYRAAPSYKPEARFSTWLFTIVRNVCSNYRTRDGRLDQQMDAESDTSHLSNPQESPEDNLIQSERRKKIRQAIQSLPESLRMPLIMHQFEHLSYDQVAEILEISLGAVKVRIHRARLALMEQLKELV